jgi:excisionase family DNA binding protein
LTEAAELLRIDAAEIVRLAERNELPARRLDSSWRFSCDALMTWLKGDWKPSDAVVGKPISDLSEIKATGTTSGQAPTASSSTPRPLAAQDKPVGEAPTERPAEDISLRGQRVLLGRGQVVVDVGQFYSRSDEQVLTFVDGAIGLASVEQQTFSTIVLGRVGIFNETELSASTTFHSQNIDQFLGNTNLSGSDRHASGGVNVGLRRTLMRERPGRPDIIAAVDGHIPTGDTQSAVGGGLVFVKSVDPVVLFTNMNYVHTFTRDVPNGTSFSPGNRFDLSLGYGLGLNDTLALSMAVSGVFNATTAVNDVRSRQSSSFSGRFGLTSWLAKGLYIEPSVSFGLSGPGRSFAFGVTMPYAF